MMTKLNGLFTKIFWQELFWKLLFNQDDEFVRTHYYYFDECQEMLDDLNQEISALTITINTIEDTYIEEKIKLDIELINLKVLVKKLEEANKEKEPIVKPEFLDDSLSYMPVVRIAAKDGDATIELMPNDIYSSNAAVDRIVATKQWQTLYKTNKKECAKKIWHYVIDRLKYNYDKEEDWRTSQITITLRKGDCEDGTILFVDLCRATGFTPDEVFNACGHFTQNGESFGHSYPILNYGEGWFIYETTYDSMKPDEPLRFKGSNYIGDWGLANDKWYGNLSFPYQI